ncbi:glycyl-tRNA synthetase beta chain [Parelusimicrobium proximum]|uniref:glycine--tRNA ligase subunit beta n=1 Tax=Parelusimicrobium proximum TaxID=3228953 RepID=UPI003D186A66
MENTNVLLQIGIEHLPSRFVKNTLKQMEEKAETLLVENNISYQSIRSFGTFRRLCIEIKNIAPKAGDIQKEVKGPPAKLLRDADGNFTIQSKGFAEKNGVKPEKLITKEVNGTPFIFADVKIKGAKTSALLPGILKTLIISLEFPKNMIWEDSGLRFARPIRSIVALYGSKVVNFELAGVKTGRDTFPLSSFGSKGVKIKDADSYAETLANQPQPIIVEIEERKQIIKKALSAEAARFNKSLADMDQDLIEETAFMTEHPVAVATGFESRFLTLPKELITTVLKKQIKIFPVLNDKYELQPYFIAFRDGISVNQAEVAGGFKKVMSARLSDAVFFYDQDINNGLESFNEKLKTVRFLEGLGTMADKQDRVKKLALKLAENLPADKKIIEEAASYAYSDLASSVVYEFPELQGYMGGVYAEKSGKSKEAAKAIEEFYFPVSSSSQLPSTIEACILSLAAKLDTIAGNFYIGQIPTGSEDPFALRRAAAGIVRMILEKDLPYGLSYLADAAFDIYGFEDKSRLPDLKAFLFDRFRNILSDKGISTGAVNSLETPRTYSMQLQSLEALSSELDKLKDNDTIKSVAENAKRVVNIIKKSGIDKESFGYVNTALFAQQEEKALWEKHELLSKTLDKYASKTLTMADCADIFAQLASLKEPLAAFFDKVMVNAEDENVKNNRLALLNGIKHKLTEQFIDITKLQ